MYIVSAKLKNGQDLATYECEQYDAEGHTIDGIYFSPDEYVLTQISPDPAEEQTEETNEDEETSEEE